MYHDDYVIKPSDYKEGMIMQYLLYLTATLGCSREKCRIAAQTEQVIKNFANQFNTHPAIIIGRLQYKKLIPYSLGREYFEPVIFE
jgi:hypothetical protein